MKTGNEVVTLGTHELTTEPRILDWFFAKFLDEPVVYDRSIDLWREKPAQFSDEAVFSPTHEGTHLQAWCEEFTVQVALHRPVLDQPVQPASKRSWCATSYHNGDLICVIADARMRAEAVCCAVILNNSQLFEVPKAIYDLVHSRN